jgi:glycosyltransferase involved in cell wall biosynthesis
MNKCEVYQINLSPSLGGAEIYSGFFSRALSALGWPTTLIATSQADYWQHIDLGQGKLIKPAAASEILAAIPDGAILVVHASAPEPLIKELAARTTLVALAHQALYNDKQPSYYRYAKLLVPVSHYVIETLKNKGYGNIFPSPLYGIGNVKASSGKSITRGQLVDWDRRKLRDQVLSALSPLACSLQSKKQFSKRPGITLGIVSRIADLKQFPELFSQIAAHIQARPNIWIEVFGSAVGYRGLQKFRKSTSRINERIRYWGLQTDMSAVYGNIDYLLTGLPEREALGLNVIEAQMCGTPVIAPRAGPFVETVIEGRGGYLYNDPRTDKGEDFARVLDMIRQSDSPPDPRRDSEHLQQFGFPVFCQRVEQLMAFITNLQRDNTHDESK